MKQETIVFVHGLHENSHSWKTWVPFFENLGYTCHAPDYPLHAGIPAMLRKDPHPGLGKLSLKDVVTHYSSFIDGLDLPPILIGHSLGGLVVQQLLQAGKGSMGICICSASPKGVWSFAWSFVKSNIGVVNPLKGNSIFCASPAWFHYAICNSLSRELSDIIYESAVVPESRNIPRSSRLKEGYVNFSKPHPPTLFIAAEKDHIIPCSLVKRNIQAYRHKDSIRQYKLFKGRSHIICSEPGWEEVARFVVTWIQQRH